MSAFSLSRSRGAAFEILTAAHLARLRYRRPELEPCTTRTQQLIEALERHPTISVGTNSIVEGVWVDRRGHPRVVECTGSPDECSKPGLVRSDNGRKLLASVTSVALVCREEHIEPPAFLIVTTGLPRSTSPAAGWIRAMLMQIRHGDLGALEIHLLDRSGGLIAEMDDVVLDHYYREQRNNEPRGGEGRDESEAPAGAGASAG